jgi:hypothetical protein
MSEGTPRTWFAGKSAPEDQRGPSAGMVSAVVMFVLSPIGAFVAIAAYYFAFSMARLSWKVIAGATGIYGALWFVLGGSRHESLRTYSAPWREIMAGIKNANLKATIESQWPSWLLDQAPLSLLLGGIAASLFSWWKWFRRPAWEANDRVPGPLDILRRKRVIKAIESDTAGPNNALTLGYTRYGRRVMQHDAEAAGHTLVAGGSGSGKTTTMLIGIRDAIRRREPVLFVDLKGAADVPEQIAEWCRRYNRPFLHWTIQDPRSKYHGPADGPAFYDPIGRGDPSRRKDLLVEAQKWDVEYYKTVVANYLQIAFQVADRTSPPGVDSFTDITLLLNHEELSKRAATLVTPNVLAGEGLTMWNEAPRPEWHTFIPFIIEPDLQALLDAVHHTVRGLDKSEQELSAIRNMRARLQTLTQSTAGAWLRKSPTGERNIDLRTVVDEGWVVVISLDSSNYKGTASQVGGLIIQDLNTLSSELRHNPAPTPFHVYIDEFSAIGTDNVLGLLARARDARMPVTLSTQALADLTRADPTFPDQVLAIISSFVIHRANTEKDATIFAGLTGEHTVFKRMLGIEMSSGMPGGVGTGAATGQGTIREEKEYRVLPEEFQELERGQLIYIAKSPKIRFEPKVLVAMENPLAVTANGNTSEVRRAPSPPRDDAEGVIELPNGRDSMPLADTDDHDEIIAPIAMTPPPVPPALVKGPRKPILPSRGLADAARRPVVEQDVAPVAAPVPDEKPVEQAVPTPARVGPPIIDPSAFRSRQPGAVEGPQAQAVRPPVPQRLVAPAAPEVTAVAPIREVQASAVAAEPTRARPTGSPLPTGFPVGLPVRRPVAKPVAAEIDAEPTSPMEDKPAVTVSDPVTPEDIAFAPVTAPAVPARSIKAVNVPSNKETVHGDKPAVIFDAKEWG